MVCLGVLVRRGVLVCWDASGRGNRRIRVRQGLICVGDGGWVAGAPFHTPNNEENPGHQLAESPNDKTSNGAIPHPIGTAGGVVIIRIKAAV